jgi:23S rRNA pseudouridine955/2504/2580 synthase/23S rRNA pseudouridine1911/1915/1917 synthase
MKNTCDIIYEDEDLVVVNKPPFLLTIPDRFHPEKPNLYHQLGERYGKIFTVHRLDRETSGILVFAKTDAAHRDLSYQFQQHSVQKIYYALLEGAMHQDEGIIDKPLAEHPSEPGKMIVAQRGKPSVTHYKVVERFKNYTLVEADIKTGRMHQIRVHFQSLGYPLAIDSLYGRKTEFLLSDVKQAKYRMGKFQEEERPLMSRTTLHAGRLTFVHPGSGQTVTFEAELPKDFGAVVKQLQKWGK